MILNQGNYNVNEFSEYLVYLFLSVLKVGVNLVMLDTDSRKSFWCELTRAIKKGVLASSSLPNSLHNKVKLSHRAVSLEQILFTQQLQSHQQQQQQLPLPWINIRH